MRILITGAAGYFGRELVRQLLLQGRHEIIAATSDLEKARRWFSDKPVRIILNTELNRGRLFGAKRIVHAAFCRASDGKELVNSLRFSGCLYRYAVEYGVSGILNLSSQSVYGGKKEEAGPENMMLDPGYLYALAKCASEQLLDQAVSFSGGKTAGSNIRLAALLGPSDVVPDNVLCKFIKNALEGRDIQIVGGLQKFSFLDVRDAASAVVRLLDLAPEHWDRAYNLGPPCQTGIIEMAETVCSCVLRYTDKKVRICVDKNDSPRLNAGMDSRKLYETLNWRPNYTFPDTVEDTVRFLTDQKSKWRENDAED